MSLHLAKEFARLIDQQGFDEVSSLIEEDCKYKYSEGKYQGRNSIVAIYRQNYLQSQKLFDEVLCSSTVEETGENTYQINFTDTIRKGPLQHTYHFYEIIVFKDNLIVDIQNCAIHEEDESLRTFFMKFRNLKNSIT